MGYLQEKEKQATEAAMQLAQDYPAVSPTELGKEKFPFLSFLSQSSSNYLTHSPSLLFSRKGSGRETKLIRRGLRFFLRFNFLAAHAKEVTEQRRALIRQYSFRNFHSVIHTRMMQHIH
ncbi:putative lytic transglycosylase [Escherichia coli]|nr:putative lytic transglycosylase [Escherichia coli]